MAEWREEGEGGEGARWWSSGGLYRPRSSWVRDVVSGGGRFLPWATQQRAGGGGSGAAPAGGVVAAREGVWDACAREEVPRGGPGGAKRFPRVHLAVGARWTKSTGGVRRAARTEQAGGEREMEIRAYL